MFTAEQYEAIGRLALAFNEIDYFVEILTAKLLRTPEYRVAVAAVKERGFAQRIQRFKMVLQALEQSLPNLEQYIAPILDVIETAKRLSQRRNKYVHAMVYEDYKTKTNLWCWGTNGLLVMPKRFVVSRTKQRQSSVIFYYRLHC